MSDGSTGDPPVECDADAPGTWQAIADAPATRYTPALWTGQHVLLWSGQTDVPYEYVSDGLRYEPATNSWSAISDVGAPPGRVNHEVVWTGDEMIVWGGDTTVDPQVPTFDFPTTGGRYRPDTDEWLPMSQVGVPLGRTQHEMVWTGDRVLVWGGTNYNLADDVQLRSGGLYDPVLDAWTPTNEDDAPAERFQHAQVWTGSTLFVWGGYGMVGPGMWGPLGDGALYDPVSDSWQPVSSEGAPPRAT